MHITTRGSWNASRLAIQHTTASAVTACPLSRAPLGAAAEGSVHEDRYQRAELNSVQAPQQAVVRRQARRAGAAAKSAVQLGRSMQGNEKGQGRAQAGGVTIGQQNAQLS